MFGKKRCAWLGTPPHFQLIAARPDIHFDIPPGTPDFRREAFSAMGAPWVLSEKHATGQDFDELLKTERGAALFCEIMPRDDE